MLETFHWFRGEGFSQIIEDLLCLPERTGVVVEGFRLLPRLVEPLLAARNQAVWLLPTSAFREAAFDSRGSKWDIAAKTSNPRKALRNLLERDRMFTERLQQEAEALQLPALQVDVMMTEEEVVDRVRGLFELGGNAATG